MLRTTLRLAQKGAGEKLVAPKLEYTACRGFAGEVPTHMIPAEPLDVKAAGLWTRQPFQINYGPNRGRYDYGVVDHPYNRSFIQILRMETHWTLRQVRYIVYMGLWMTPMILAHEEWYRREEEGKQRG